MSSDTQKATPRSTRRWENMPADTRQRIEQAVMDVFSETEYHKTKLVDIAKAANVSLQTLYKYYGDKETLLFAVLDKWLGTLAERMIDHLTGIENFKDRLRKVFWVMLDFFERNPKVPQLIMSSVHIGTFAQSEAYRQPELVTLFFKVLNEGRAKGVLTTEVDEVFLLDFIIGVTERVTFMWIARGRLDSLVEKTDLLFDMIWRAIANPQQEPHA